MFANICGGPEKEVSRNLVRLSRGEPALQVGPHELCVCCTAGRDGSFVGCGAICPTQQQAALGQCVVGGVARRRGVPAVIRLSSCWVEVPH